MTTTKKSLAPDRFKKGDRVQQTKAWDDHAKFDPRSKKQRTGTVVGFSRNRKYVNVRIDGLKTATGWHPDFWAAVVQPKTVAAKSVCFNDDDGCTLTEAELNAAYETVPETAPSDAWSTVWAGIDRMIERLFGPFKHFH